MYFTDFIVIENTGNSVDPLGFLRPSSFIRDGLFEQFTVLSNHPAYHGFLCYAYQLLGSKGIVPGTPRFSIEFRNVEALWGILNAQAGDSIVNVTKYKTILTGKQINLKEVKKYNPLFDRLGYGTLGHYSRPSITWGLLSRNGVKLTELGERLGTTWSRRGSIKISRLMEKWLDGDDVMKLKDYHQATKLFKLSATPEESEQLVWQEIIESNCEKNPVTAPLWMNPLTPETQLLAKDEGKYPGFFPKALEHFMNEPKLCQRIDLCQRFELLAGLIQFVFEWEYVQRLEQVKKIGLTYEALQGEVARQINIHASEFVRLHGPKKLWSLFEKLSELNAYEEQARVILTHHSNHQKVKRATGYIEGDRVAVMDKVDPKNIAGLLSFFKQDLSRLNNKIGWHYKRDWHFDRAALWLEYSGGRI